MDPSHSQSLQRPLELSDVLVLDEMVQRNVQATLKGAHSYVEWDTSSIPFVSLSDNLLKFQVAPLMATVDRRPMTARLQIVKDKHNLHYNGKLLGCALSTSTFVSSLQDISVSRFKGGARLPAKCDICFQFSSREDMLNFLPGIGYEPLKKGHASMATKCFGGTAEVSSRFGRWQKDDERFVGFGYPFTVDCRLMNGIKELACHEITRLYDDPNFSDILQNIYLSTRFTLKGYFSDDATKTFAVRSTWPWDAVRSHDDDRTNIAQSLPITWNDTTSRFIPARPSEMILAHVEGPAYSVTEIEQSKVLQGMMLHPDSTGGVHPRLTANLIHLLRLAPGSTHMIAVVDGQLRRTLEYMNQVLRTKVTDLYPQHAEAILHNILTLKTKNYIPVHEMLQFQTNAFRTQWSKVTLRDLLFYRGIKIHIVPLATPSIAFENTVCGIQYQFTSYLAARYAADFQVMIYMDGDTTFLEHSSKTLQEILYDRLFSENSHRCVGHRFRLLEQFVRPDSETPDQVLQCTNNLSSNISKWHDTVKNCSLKEGHIAARTDSIYEFNVHHPDTLSEYLTSGLRDCIPPGNQETEEYFFDAEEIVQIHLRNRERKIDCAC